MLNLLLSVRYFRYFLIIGFSFYSCVLASNIKRLDLSEDFQFDKTISRHMESLKQSWSGQVESLSKNHLKVGLYAYHRKEGAWDFFEDPNLYVSGWKCTHKGQNSYTLGKVYDSNDYDDLDKKAKTKIQKDFKARNISISMENDFPYQTYAHSEQAHISWLQNSSFNDALYDKKLKKSNYSNFLMLYVSTNEMCNGCSGALSSLLDEDMLSGLVYRFSGLPERIKKVKIAMKEDTFNIFYIALHPKHKIVKSVDLSEGNSIYHTISEKCLIF